jgi:hypothetical protein
MFKPLGETERHSDESAFHQLALPISNLRFYRGFPEVEKECMLK